MLFLWPRALSNVVNLGRNSADKVNTSFLFDFVKTFAKTFDEYYNHVMVIVVSSLLSLKMALKKKVRDMKFDICSTAKDDATQFCDNDSENLAAESGGESIRAVYGFSCDGS